MSPDLASFWEGLGHWDRPKLAPNRSKKGSPNRSKKWPHFFFEPTWLHFGKAWGIETGLSWHQIGPKRDLQIDPKNDHILDRFWIQFWSILDLSMAPKRGPKNFFFHVILALEPAWGPGWVQDSPRSSKIPVLVDLWTKFKRISEKMRCIFQQCLLKFWFLSLDDWANQGLWVPAAGAKPENIDMSNKRCSTLSHLEKINPSFTAPRALWGVFCFWGPLVLCILEV